MNHRKQACAYNFFIIFKHIFQISVFKEMVKESKIENWKKVTEVIWSCDPPCPLSIENWSKCFPPLDTRMQLHFLCIKTLTPRKSTKLANKNWQTKWVQALEIVSAIEVNSLVPIIPHIKILVWGKTSHDYLWYTPLLQEHNLAIGLVYKTKSLVSNWWEIRVRGFFGKSGHGW